MKKIFTLVMMAAAFAASASAQIKVTCEGQEVTNNKVLTFFAENNGLEIKAGPELDPTFTNESDETQALEVEVNAGLGYQGKGLNWCGVTTACADITGSSESRTVNLVPGASVPMKLHGVFEEGNYSQYTARVTVWVDETTKVLQFIERFIYSDPAAVSQVSVADAKVMVSGGTLHYTFGAAKTRTLNVYSTDGKLVKSVALTSANGEVALNGLQQGVYVYTLTAGAEKEANGKFLLK